MKRTIIISSVVVISAILFLVVFNRVASVKKTESLFSEVRKGTFEITVNGAGELLAEKSIDIRGPEFIETEAPSNERGQQGRGGPQMGHSMHAMDLKIQDLVPEGTMVKTGDYVAQLDRTNYDNTMRDEIQNLATLRSQMELKILDTAVTLSSLRDQIKNQVYTVEEASINLDQAQFEPPAVIKQAKARLDREQRTLDQLRKTYKLRVAQTISEINGVRYNVEYKERQVTDLQTYLSKFTILAPADGMIIYKKERNGAKRKTGSSLNPFDMVVATLPDLSVMQSKMYVSEIEVSKVVPGQEVEIKVDAFPNKQYKGTVISIANVGEQLPNSDAKMFETMIKLNDSDPALRTSMTTGNKILIKSIDDVIFLPAECVHAGTDSIPFVYLKNKTKRVVLLGESNEKNIIIERGLEPGTNVYLITPPDAETFRLTGEELIPVIRSTFKVAENKR